MKLFQLKQHVNLIGNFGNKMNNNQIYCPFCQKDIIAKDDKCSICHITIQEVKEMNNFSRLANMGAYGNRW